MKKSIFMVALAALAMTSCSQDEILEVKKDAISFEVVSDNASRATVTTATTLESFKVYGYVTEDGEKKTYIDGLTTTKSGSKYTLADGYYWPSNAVDFYCISNADLSLDDTNTLSAYYSVLNDHNDDLLYSVLKGQTKEGLTGGTAPLNFRHALAMVQFQVKSLATYGLDVVVDKIQLCNVAQSGKYTLPNYTTNPNLADPNEEVEANDANAGIVDNGNEEEGDANEFRTRGSWALKDVVEEAYTWTVGGEDGLSALASTNSGDQLSDASETFFLMPQTFTAAVPASGAWNGAYFLINCTVTKNGVKLHDDKVAIPASAIGQEDTEWKEGYKYVYTLTFGQGGGYQPGTTDPVVIPISFSVTVDQFQNAADEVQVQVPAVDVTPVNAD